MTWAGVPVAGDLRAGACCRSDHDEFSRPDHSPQEPRAPQSPVHLCVQMLVSQLSLQEKLPAGVAGELGRRQPGMMTLIALATQVRGRYSALVVLGLHGRWGPSRPG